eukprot:jgi/Hompol1/5866/HPOL_000116-RA
MQRLDQENLEKNARILLARQKKEYQIMIATLKRQIRHLKYQRNSLADPLIEAKYFPYLPRTEFSNSARKPPYGIIGNLPPRSSDYFALNPPEPTGNHPDSGHRWWWEGGHGIPHWAHLPPTRPTTQGTSASMIPEPVPPSRSLACYSRPSARSERKTGDIQETDEHAFGNVTMTRTMSPGGTEIAGKPNTSEQQDQIRTAPNKTGKSAKGTALSRSQTTPVASLTAHVIARIEQSSKHDRASSKHGTRALTDQSSASLANKESIANVNAAHHFGDESGNKSEAEIGDRVCVVINEERCLGVLKYVGVFEAGSAGVWCGIQLDRPLGTHDGTVRGRRYFECKENHGIFVKLDKVIVVKHSNVTPKSTTKVSTIF